MRQRRWLALLKDYNKEVKYHLGEANVMDDALNWKPKGVITSLLTTEKRLLRELDALQIEVILPGDWSHLAELQLTSPFVERIKLQRKKTPS